MFDEIEFDKIKRLPKYVFAAVNELKMAERRAGEDVIDFSMGNPDGPTPSILLTSLSRVSISPEPMDTRFLKESTSFEEQ